MTTEYVTTTLSVSVTVAGEEQTAVYGKNAIHKLLLSQRPSEAS